MKKKNYAIVLVIIINALIIAMFFIPWYRNEYVLIEKNAVTNIEETTKNAVWLSPFLNLVLDANWAIGSTITFFLFLVISLLTLVIEIYSLVKKNIRKKAYISFTITIAIFIVLIFLTIFLAPTK